MKKSVTTARCKIIDAMRRDLQINNGNYRAKVTIRLNALTLPSLVHTGRVHAVLAGE